MEKRSLFSITLITLGILTIFLAFFTDYFLNNNTLFVSLIVFGLALMVMGLLLLVSLIAPILMIFGFAILWYMSTTNGLDYGAIHINWGGNNFYNYGYIYLLGMMALGVIFGIIEGILNLVDK